MCSQLLGIGLVISMQLELLDFQQLSWMVDQGHSLSWEGGGEEEEVEASDHLVSSVQPQNCRHVL